MWWLRSAKLLLITAIVGFRAQDEIHFPNTTGSSPPISIDYDYSNYDDIDDCSFYDHEAAGDCHHQKFPVRSVQQHFATDKVKTCCQHHGYLFYDKCEANTETYKTYACGRPSGQPTLPLVSVNCPLHCKHLKLEQGKFNIDANGQISLSESNVQGVTVFDHCVAYHCGHASWTIVADVCLCFNSSLVQAKDSEVPPDLPRCCPDTKQIIHRRPTGPANQQADDYVDCPLDIQSKLKASDSEVSAEEVGLKHKRNVCPRKFHDYMFGSRVNINRAENKIVIEDTRIVTLDLNSTEYCVGVNFDFVIDDHFDVSRPFRNFIMVCSEPCNGKKPCVRTCCRPDEIFTEDAFCQQMNSSVRSAFFNSIHLTPENDESYNYDKADSFDRSCPSGYERKPYLDPSKRCRDRFELKLNDSQVQLRVLSSGQVYQDNEFCLNFNHDANILPEICREIIKHHKLEFYPYVLLVSAGFLLITFIIYSKYTKLLNHYTRIMRHFTFSMMVSFTILSINQLVAIGNYSQALCKYFGYLEQFLFVCTFSLMTSMSVDLWMQMSGKPSTDRRYFIEIASAYVFAAIVVVVTFVADKLLPTCSPFRPRFGEEHCFFLEKAAKGVWFFLPIGLMLFINAIMFICTITLICKMDKKKRELNIRSSKNRNDKMEKFLMYLKMFIGMGFIWSFEIVAGLTSDDIHESSWYVTDILNMLQGFYIFVIFVCKRNVLNVIFASKRGKMTVATNSNTKKATSRGGVMALRILHRPKDSTSSNTACNDSIPTNVTDVPDDYKSGSPKF